MPCFLSAKPAIHLCWLHHPNSIPTCFGILCEQLCTPHRILGRLCKLKHVQRGDYLHLSNKTHFGVKEWLWAVGESYFEPKASMGWIKTHKLHLYELPVQNVLAGGRDPSSCVDNPAGKSLHLFAENMFCLCVGHIIMALYWMCLKCLDFCWKHAWSYCWMNWGSSDDASQCSGNLFGKHVWEHVWEHAVLMVWEDGTSCAPALSPCCKHNFYKYSTKECSIIEVAGPMLAGNKHRYAQLHLLDCSDGDSSTPGRILPKRIKPWLLIGIVGVQGTHHIH